MVECSIVWMHCSGSTINTNAKVVMSSFMESDYIYKLLSASTLKTM